MESQNHDDIEEARYRLFRRRPGLGVMLMGIGIGIPVSCMAILGVLAPEFFFSSNVGKVVWFAILGLAIWLGIFVSERIRKSAITREANAPRNPE